MVHPFQAHVACTSAKQPWYFFECLPLVTRENVQHDLENFFTNIKKISNNPNLTHVEKRGSIFSYPIFFRSWGAKLHFFEKDWPQKMGRKKQKAGEIPALLGIAFSKKHVSDTS